MPSIDSTEVWLLELDVQSFEASRFIGLGDMAMYYADGEKMWIKIEGPGQKVQRQLMQLPGARWHAIDGKLVPPNHRVPVRSMPSCEWITAEQWFQIELPRAHVARRPSDSFRVALKLQRGGTAQVPNALDTSIQHLRPWVETAAERLLQPLKYTVAPNDEFRCIVIGQPLPPVPGTYLIESAKTLVPAGFHWQPAVNAETVRDVFDVAETAWLYWESDELFHVFEEHHLEPLTKASLRSIHDV